MKLIQYFAQLVVGNNSRCCSCCKGLNPNVKVIGVQTASIPSMQESVKNGEVTTAFHAATIADGIAVNPGDTFEIIKELVDDIITVTEEEIAQGMLFLLEHQK